MGPGRREGSVVPVSWFQVSSFRFKVSGFGFQVSGFEFQVSGFRFQVSGFRFRVSGFGFRVSGFRVRNSGPRAKIQVSGFTTRFRINFLGWLFSGSGSWVWSGLLSQMHDYTPSAGLEKPLGYNAAASGGGSVVVCKLKANTHTHNI